MYTLLHYMYTYFPGCLYPTLSYMKVLRIGYGTKILWKFSNILFTDGSV